MNEISFFDLDGTIWNIKNDDIWIIDKEKPYKPLVILSRTDFALIKAGKFKGDNIPLKYNGNTHYISKDLFEKIIKKSGSENIERFGISFIPLLRKEILDKREIDVLSHNIEHLRYNKFIDIGLLTARSNQKNHADLINRLRLELKKIGIEISKIFFVGNSIHFEDNAKKKVYVLLEHLIGLKIKDGQFISIKQDWYKKVSFYDDDFKNIANANDIQTYFEDILRKTDDELFRIIIDRLKNFELTLDTYLVTNNELNKFKKNTIILREPLRFPLKEEDTIKESSIMKYNIWNDNKLNEAIKWYSKGKFTPDENDNVKKKSREYDDFITDDRFRKFLIDNGCYDEYIENSMNPRCANKIHGYGMIFKNPNPNLSSFFISYPFTWSVTKEGNGYWKKLNNKWVDYLIYLNEAIKWYSNGKFEEDENEPEENDSQPETTPIGIGMLVGKTLSNVDINNYRTKISFKTKDGKKYLMYHEQDCCEDVSIDDINGDIEDIIDTPILRATEDTNRDNVDYDSITWTFYNISTIKGHLTITWKGTSNGYYSESVDFIEIDPADEDFYG